MRLRSFGSRTALEAACQQDDPVAIAVVLGVKPGHQAAYGEPHDVREDEILVEIEIVNTGGRPGRSPYYFAAFDAEGAIVAGPGDRMPKEPGVGERLVTEGSLSHDPRVEMDADRVEIPCPATASMDAS